MRILFLSAAKSIHTIKWVNALADKGNKVLLVSLPDHKETNKNISNKVKVVYLKYSGGVGYYLNAAGLRRISEKFRPDVINAHYASGYGTLARMARLPYTILSVWGSDVYDFPYENKIKMHIVRANLKYAYKIASTSFCMAKQTNSIMCRDMHCTITPFGVDTDVFIPMQDSKNKSERFVFGTVKSLTPKYGIDDLINGYSIFVNNTDGAKDKTELCIYGGGEDEVKLKALAKTKCANIRFMGIINNAKVPAALNSMDVFCCCSVNDSESFGVSAVEAMACGLPVISSDVDGFKEVTVDGETGFTVPRRKPEAIAEKMKQLYLSSELRRRFGEAGRKRVVEKYQWNKNVDTMMALYSKVAKEKKHGE